MDEHQETPLVGLAQPGPATPTRPPLPVVRKARNAQTLLGLSIVRRHGRAVGVYGLHLLETEDLLMTPERLAELRRLQEAAYPYMDGSLRLDNSDLRGLLDHIDELEKRINAMDAEKGRE